MLSQYNLEAIVKIPGFNMVVEGARVNAQGPGDPRGGQPLGSQSMDPWGCELMLWEAGTRSASP